MEKLYILWKRLLSYRKKTWNAGDYPIKIQASDTPSSDEPRFSARIIYSGFSGFGETKAEALADLHRVYEWVKENDPAEIQRPGVLQPIRFASRAGLDDHPETEEKFIDLVLGFGPNAPLFISDESSIFDFGDESSRLIEKTKEYFGVDIRDIEDGNILKIIERIDSSKMS